MDDRKLLNSSRLCVIIEGAEFAKEFNYFISVQLEGEVEKRRTDISAKVTNPIFSANTFYLELPSSKAELNTRLFFSAFVVANREGSGGQARLLGECALELGPLAPALIDVKGAGTRQHLKFARYHEGKQVTVGRFLVTLRIVTEANFQEASSDVVEIFHPLPAMDPFAQFNWRVRVDFRAAVDLPLNRVSESGLPSSTLEFGWSQYLQQMPGDNETFKTKVFPNSRHPFYNQQHLYLNPPNLKELDGFFWIILKDKAINEVLEIVTVPASIVRPYHPVHMEIITTRRDQLEVSPAKFYCSLTIEEAVNSSFVDHLVDIAIMGVNWDPVPNTISNIMVAMTTQGKNLTSVPFGQIDLTGETNLSRELLKQKSARESVFITPVLSVIPKRFDNPYGCQAVFTVPRSYLENQVAFYLIVRDENSFADSRNPLPGTIVGYTQILDDDLQSSLYARQDKNIYVPLIWDSSSPMYRSLGQSKASIQLAVYNLDVSFT